MSKTMWKTPSSSLILLLLTCLMKIGEIRAQCERPFVGENRVLDNDSGQTIFPDGTKVTFKCATGYHIDVTSGSRTITCSGQKWSPLLALQCKKKSCGYPGNLNNGRYLTPNGVLFGATATAQCNEGYMLVGAKLRNCVDGGWDGREAVCEVTKCRPPPPITNGDYEPVDESYDYMNAVTFTCNPPYSLVGAQSISCSSDGTFEPSPPQCLELKCDAPKIDNAVRIEGKAPPYYDGHFVGYQCIKGYKMQGDGYMICGVNGWNPPPPVCIETPGWKPSPEPGPDPTPEPTTFLGRVVTWFCDKNTQQPWVPLSSCVRL